MPDGESITLESQALAELVISAQYTLPDKLESAYSITFGAEARNNGAGESGPFKVRFTVDGDIHEFSWPSLAPGQSHWEEWEHPPLPAGSHTFYVNLDYDNVVQESNKNDNQGALNFEVSDPPPPAPEVSTYVPMHLDDTSTTDSDEKGTEVVGQPAIDVGVGGGAAGQINSLVDDLHFKINQYWENYRDGLEAFKNKLEHAAEEEAESHALHEALVAGAKKLFDAGLEALGEFESVGPWAVALGVVKEAEEAWDKENDRAAAAGGDVKLGDYLTDAITSIGKRKKEMLDSIDGLKDATSRDSLHAQYRDKVAQDPQHGKANDDGIIEGPGAEFLYELKKRVIAFWVPEMSYFWEQITEGFANTPGLTRITLKGPAVTVAEGQSPEQIAKEHPEWIDEGGRPAGTLYLNLNVKMSDEFPVMGSSAKKWTLALNLPGKEPGRVAASLQKALETDHRMPWQSTLPKTVTISVYDSGGNDLIAEGSIHFTFSADVDQPEIEVKSAPDYVTDREGLFRTVWKARSVRQHITNASEIVGSDQ